MVVEGYPRQSPEGPLSSGDGAKSLLLAWNYMKQKVTGSERNINNSTIIVGHFNILLPTLGML